MHSHTHAAEDHEGRSDFVRALVLATCAAPPSSPDPLGPVPHTIVHFWHDFRALPNDVRECIASWEPLAEHGYTLLLFDTAMARSFIYSMLGARFRYAFDQCYHPAMQSDYFRLCYILSAGGCYIDADDFYSGADLTSCVTDGRLGIQPLCYDIASNTMVPPSEFCAPGSDTEGRIFYFNNNPLIARAGHPIIAHALMQATAALELDLHGTLPDIQSTTGPGNLTKAIYDLTRRTPAAASALHVLHDWEHIATTRWPLSYRNDARNWRRSNGVRFSQPALPQ